MLIDRRQRNWQFGDMPPLTGIRREEVAQIVAFIRALQEAAGLR